MKYFRNIIELLLARGVIKQESAQNRNYFFIHTIEHIGIIKALRDLTSGKMYLSAPLYDKIKTLEYGDFKNIKNLLTSFDLIFCRTNVERRFLSSVAIKKSKLYLTQFLGSDTNPKNETQHHGRLKSLAIDKNANTNQAVVTLILDDYADYMLDKVASIIESISKKKPDLIFAIYGQTNYNYLFSRLRDISGKIIIEAKKDNYHINRLVNSSSLVMLFTSKFSSGQLFIDTFNSGVPCLVNANVVPQDVIEHYSSSTQIAVLNFEKTPISKICNTGLSLLDQFSSKVELSSEQLTVDKNSLKRESILSLIKREK